MEAQVFLDAIAPRLLGGIDGLQRLVDGLQLRRRMPLCRQGRRLPFDTAAQLGDPQYRLDRPADIQVDGKRLDVRAFADDSAAALADLDQTG
ncbi:hypothetical protein D3C72_1947060 [compost metagenome]